MFVPFLIVIVEILKKAAFALVSSTPLVNNTS